MSYNLSISFNLIVISIIAGSLLVSLLIAWLIALIFKKITSRMAKKPKKNITLTCNEEELIVLKRENASLAAQIEVLKNDISASGRAKENSSQELAALTKKIEETEKMLKEKDASHKARIEREAALTKELYAVKDELEKNKSEVNLLAGQNKDLKEQVTSLEKTLVSESDRGQELEKRIKENRGLKQQISDLQRKENEHKVSFASMEKELKTAKEDIKVKADEVAAISKSNKDYIEALKEKEATLASTQENLGHIKAEFAEAQKKETNANDARDTLLQQLTFLEKDFYKLQDQLKTKEEKEKELQNKLSSAIRAKENEASSAQKTISSINTELENIKDLNQSLSAEVQKLKQANCNLEEKLQEKNLILSKEQASAQETTAMINKELAASQKNESETREKLNYAIRKLEELEKTYLSEKEALEKEKDKNREGILAIETEQNKVLTLQHEKENLEKELDTAKEMIKAAQDSTPKEEALAAALENSKSLKSQLETAREENLKMSAEISMMKQSKEQNQSAAEKISACLKNELSESRKKEESLNEKLTSAVEKLNNLEKEYDTLKKEYQNRLEKRTQEESGLRTELNQMRQENQRFSESIVSLEHSKAKEQKAAEEKNTSLQEKLKIMETEYLNQRQRLINEIKEMKTAEAKSKDEFSKKLKDVNTDLEAEKNKIKELANGRQGVEKQLAIAQETAEALKKQLSVYKDRETKLQETLNSATERINSLEKNIKDQEKKTNIREEENNELTVLNERLSAEQEKLEQEIAKAVAVELQLKEELQDTQEESKELTDKIKELTDQKEKLENELKASQEKLITEKEAAANAALRRPWKSEKSLESGEPKGHDALQAWVRRFSRGHFGERIWITRGELEEVEEEMHKKDEAIKNCSCHPHHAN